MALQEIESFMRIRSILAATLVLFGLVATSAAQQIWLSAVDPVVRAAHQWDASVDYMDLFRPDAPWSTVAKQVRVFKIGPGFASQGREEDLKQIFADLQRRHIALALEIGMLTHSSHCNEKSEAYGPPGLVETLLSRVKRLGGTIDYIAMDEPFYYGHEYAAPDACRLSAAQLAEDVAPNVAVAKRIFPGIKIGDVEVVYSSPEFTEATKMWMDAYSKATGERLYFFHADVSWSPQAMRNLVPLAAFAKSRLVRFGVIYNAGSQGTSDALWTQAAIRNANRMESEFGLHPEDAVFQTWEKFPSHLLPETTPGTLTNVVLNYLNPRSTLTLNRNGTQLRGRLIDSKGAPIPHAPITLDALGEVSDAAMVHQSISGNVPENARFAALAVRANKELGSSCTSCMGAVSARIGAAQYHEGSSGGASQKFPPSHFEVGAAQSVYTNSSKFAVTPGASFTFEVPLAVHTNAERAGSIGVLFMDAAGHEVRRTMIHLKSTEATLGKVETGADGSFVFNMSQPIPQGQTPTITALFDGTDHIRGTAAAAQ
jgi:hypothetical protein